MVEFLSEATAQPEREALLRFVERFALVLAEAGMARTPARVFAYVLAEDSDRYTAAELAEGLGLSRAAISSATRDLVQGGLLGREREPGARVDSYRVYDSDVWEAINRQRLPILEKYLQVLDEGIELLGIDSDNGGEFINDLLYRYCLDEQITFTRSRPYQKNDQAHVEQKNWSVVRHTVGYDRWETEQELALLESIYDAFRLYINFFQPSLKLIAKERIGHKTIKRYDTAKTPYHRVLDRKDISLEAKARLTQLYVQLNPAELRRQIDQKIANLWNISR